MTAKIWSSAAAALAGTIRDGMVLAVGGFGLSGIPRDLIEAVRDSGVRNIITDRAVFDVVDRALVLRQIAPGHTVEELRTQTAAPFTLDADGDVEIAAQAVGAGA